MFLVASLIFFVIHFRNSLKKATNHLCSAYRYTYIFHYCILFWYHVADNWEIAGCWWLYIIWMLCTSWRDRTETVKAGIDAHEWKTCPTTESLRDNYAPVLLHPVQASVFWPAFWGVAEVVFFLVWNQSLYPVATLIIVSEFWNLYRSSTLYLCLFSG
jgi:hypothetical protein